MKTTELIENAVSEKLGVLSQDGALIVRTGKSTGRSTKERYMVKGDSIESLIDWGPVNQAIDPEFADNFFAKLGSYLDQETTFSMSGFAGCYPVSVKSTSPWHIAFANNMFREEVIESVKAQVQNPQKIEIFHAPDLKVSQLGIEHKFEKLIILDPEKMKVGIVGTGYAGEIKKSAFTLCNFAFPREDKFPMHASANCRADGSNSSVLFGLSGTGKTTLSADPERALIGDDEIVWSNQGISNIEGGCYAKLIDLCPKKEPDIFSAANRFGSILENVSFCTKNRSIDFENNEITENTRGSYSLSSLDNVFDQSREADHPTSIVFLTADAFGVLPAVARLDSWQAQYHFMSGYTAKVAGTEIGVNEPEATFSACFGAPFMPHPVSVYGELLAKKMNEYKSSVWLLNTGWTDFGKGPRFPIPVSRHLLTAIQSGALDNVEMVKHPVFDFMVPKEVPGVDSKYLKIPEGEAVSELAKRFIDNANAKFASLAPEVVMKGGPAL